MSGFMGCFGVLAAVVVVIIAVMIIGTAVTLNTESRMAKGEATASDYRSMCVMAVVKAKRYAPSALRYSEASPADPTIILSGPHARIQCAYTDQNGRIGAVTADVVCQNSSERDCVHIVAVIKGGGGVAYQETTGK